ncbi:hypothetical protein K1719_008626 [Acacia pycnantha]|nr:hypothetical protein K1719_008626 [Acacia pycnantha]
MILERFKGEGQLIYPGFSDVDPSEALAQLKKRFIGRRDEVEERRWALSRPADLLRYHFLPIIWNALWIVGSKIGRPFQSVDYCNDIDIMKAFDDATGDGVGIISPSLGFDDSYNCARDPLAIASLHAMKKNVVVVSTVGNHRPTNQTVTNVAPWLITVGASSIDRSFPAPIVLADDTEIQGQSITPAQMDNNLHTLALASKLKNQRFLKCYQGIVWTLEDSLDVEKVKGKIVVCLEGQDSGLHQSEEVKNNGGVGIIVRNDPEEGNDIPLDPYQIPSSAVAFEDTKKLIHYIRTTNDPEARILPAHTSLNSKPAPTVTSFSGRGPNPIDPNFIKTDIIGPGSDI